jgi:hypothetical protein
MSLHLEQFGRKIQGAARKGLMTRSGAGGIRTTTATRHGGDWQ